MKEIILTTGQVTLVDDDVYEWASRYTWRYYKNKKKRRGYVVRHNPESRRGSEKADLRLHREILGSPEGLLIDHISGDTLDNRRENLRVVTNSQNMENRIGNAANNTSGYRGVSYFKPRRKWRAYLKTKEYGFVILGYFDTPEEANEAAVAGRQFYMTHARD